jgi:hypothetical protein
MYINTMPIARGFLPPLAKFLYYVLRVKRMSNGAAMSFLVAGLETFWRRLHSLRRG